MADLPTGPESGWQVLSLNGPVPLCLGSLSSRGTPERSVDRDLSPVPYLCHNERVNKYRPSGDTGGFK